MLNIKTSLFLACACLSTVIYANETPEPNRSNTLSIAGSLEFTNIDPSSNGYLFTRMQVIETLLNVNPQGQLLPALAKSYHVSNGGKTWLFSLNDNIKFHDGQTMDANVVVQSLIRARSKHGPLNNVPILSIHAIENQKIEITLSRPYRPLGAVLAHYSTAIIGSESYDNNGKIVRLNGTGPYQIDQLAPPHKITVKRFADYWGDVASIEYATYLTGHRAESRALQVTSGQADIAYELSPTSTIRMKMQPHIKVHDISLPRTLVIKLNSGDPLLNDVRARQALSLSIDRQGIANGVLRTPGAETSQLLPETAKNWYLTEYAAPNYNIDKAQQLLSDLGWTKNENGILIRNGAPFELTLITYADRPELTNVATAIQAQWRRLGVQLKVNITNSSAIPSGHNDGSLQVALIARNYGVIADPLAVLSNDFSPTGGDWGAMNWNDPSLNALFNKLNITNDPNEYHQLAQQAAEKIHHGYALLPIASYTQRVGVNQRVQDFHFDPYERQFPINKMEFSR